MESAGLPLIKRFLPLLALLAVTVAVFATGLDDYLSLDTLRDHGAAMAAWTDKHFLLVLAALMVIFTLLTASVMPGVIFVTLAAGYLFGPWIGAIATALAATVGALLIYYAGRSALGEALKNKLAKDKGVMKRLSQGVERNTFWYVLTSRLIVTMPFHLISATAGILSVPLRPYLAATFLGLLPVHLIYCWIGSGLQEVLLTNPDPDIASLARQFIWPLICVGFLSVLLPTSLQLAKARSAARTKNR